MNMSDGNTAALRQHELDEERREQFQTMAEADRESLVLEKLGDLNLSEFSDILEKMATDPEAMHALVEIVYVVKTGDFMSPVSRNAVLNAAAMLGALFYNIANGYFGDALVDEEARRLMEIKNEH